MKLFFVVLALLMAALLIVQIQQMPSSFTIGCSEHDYNNGYDDGQEDAEAGEDNS